MVTLYNKIANQSPERLAALSDGVFAFALTLLVLDLRLPEAGGIHSEHDLWRALVGQTPSIVMYLMSFLTLGIFWNGQQTQMNFLARCDRDLTWMYIAFLFAVTLLPFSTKLLAAFISYRTALLVYWLNILLLGSVLYCCWRYANHAGLIKEDTPMRNSAGDTEAGGDCAIDVCAGSGDVRDQHAVEHRFYLCGAVVLRDCATQAAGWASVIAKSRA